MVYREQLLAAGVTAAEIRTRLETGRLIELHRGVYRVGPVAPPLAAEQAALFACRPGAVLSHFSAAAVWRLRSYGSGAPIWVTVRYGRCPKRRNVRVRRAEVERVDVRNREGLAVMSPSRTILDCAALLADRYALESMVGEAAYRHLASLSELEGQLERNRGRPGTSALREVLALPGGPQRTRSSGERQFLRILRRNGFRGFEVNSRIHGWEVDFLWREIGFAVELDGWEGHSSRTAFERDRLKWAELGAAGIHVMPISGRQMARDERGVMDRLWAALNARARTDWRLDAA